MRRARAVAVWVAVSLVTGTMVAGDDPRWPLVPIGWRAVWSAPAAPGSGPSRPPLVAVSERGVAVATPREAVEVRDPATGAVRRVVPPSAGPITGLWIAAGTLVTAISEPDSPDQSLYGYDLATGTPLWQRTIVTSRRPSPDGGGSYDGPRILVTERAVVVTERTGALTLSALGVRTGWTTARAALPTGCHLRGGATARVVVFAGDCADGAVRLTALDPATLRQIWTHPLTSLRSPDDPAAGSFSMDLTTSAAGYIRVRVDDEGQFAYADDGRPLPVPRDATVERLLQAGPLTISQGVGEWRPLPAYLVSVEPGSGRLDAAPLDLPASAGPAVGGTGDLAFVYDDGGDGERVIAYRRVRGRLPGPVTLGGVEPGSWPDACALLTSRDLGTVAGGYRPLPHRRTVGALPLPKPASCDWIPPSDDGAVVSVSVVWVARSDAEARALFDAAVSADKTYGAYDPITEGPGFFTTMVSGGVEGAFGRTLVHVGPVIAEVVSTSARALRIVAPLVRDRMGAPGGGRPVPAGGWSQATDGSVAETPLVDDGVVYFNSHDDRLYAFDAATGRPRWIIAADVSLEAVADGLVYASGADNRLYAFDAATGRRWWSHQRTFSGSTVVMAGSVIAVDSVEVVALDAATGRPRWRLPQLGGDTGLAVADNRLYAWGEDEVVALDPESGDVLWRRGARNARLVASGGALYVGDVGTAYALDPATGKARWTTPFRGPVTPVSVTPGTVYFTDEANRTYALDAGTGERQWSFLAKAVKSIGHEAAATRDLAYVAGPDERLHALDPASGARRWSRLLPGGPYTPLVIHGGVCYVGDGAGVLHAFDAATGVERWSFSLGATVQAGPVVTDGHVYVGGGNGILFGLRATDGAAG